MSESLGSSSTDEPMNQHHGQELLRTTNVVHLVLLDPRFLSLQVRSPCQPFDRLHQEPLFVGDQVELRPC